MSTPSLRRAVQAAAQALASLPAHKRLDQLKAKFGDAFGRDRTLRSLANSVVRTKPRSWGGIARIREKPAGEIASEIARLAGGNNASSFMRELLAQLGPAGQALKALVTAKDLSQVPVSKTAIDDAVSLLKEAGFEVRMPTAAPPIQAPPPTSRVRTGEALPPRTGAPRQPDIPTVTPTGSPQGPTPETGAFPGNLYVPMELVTSSNVYAIGYDAQTMTMRVQYLGTAISHGALSGKGHRGKKRVKGQLGKTAVGNRGGAGPTYDYSGVPPRVFERIRSAGSKGKAIWDNLRIRGTVYGHKFDYKLVAASVADVVNIQTGKRMGRVTYVPRRASGPGTFEGRTMRQGVGRAARTFRSLLPNER
jgi:hypothetical protein